MWNIEWESTVLRPWLQGIAIVAMAACNRLSNTPSVPPRDAQPEKNKEAEADVVAPWDGQVAAGPVDALGIASDARGHAANAGAEAGLEPIPGDPLFTNLSVPGFPEAVVSVPNGATSVRPVVVVLHGSADRPDWNCDAWRHITTAYAFILCPRGAYDAAESTKDDRRYTLRGGAYLRAYLDAALRALEERFGAYVDIDRPLVTGFSLGATEIGQLAIGDPARFPRVAQLEGGYGVWTLPATAAFSAAGGRSVLFGCGSSWCTPSAKAAAARLEKAGISSRVVFAPVGHTSDRPLQEALMGQLEWFLEGDPRWLGWLTAR
jgi:hypothetical protein